MAKVKQIKVDILKELCFYVKYTAFLFFFLFLGTVVSDRFFPECQITF